MISNAMMRMMLDMRKMKMMRMMVLPSLALHTGHIDPIDNTGSLLQH